MYKSYAFGSYINHIEGTNSFGTLRELDFNSFGWYFFDQFPVGQEFLPNGNVLAANI